MTRTLMAPEKLKNKTAVLGRYVDAMYLGASVDEVYVVPADVRYCILSGTGAFYVRKYPLTLSEQPLGLDFTNQPANDGCLIVSSDENDTTQIVTLIGTTNGTDTVVLENVALDGTNTVSSVKMNWGKILAVKISAATVGSITVSERSGGLEISTVPAGNLSWGVVPVTGSGSLCGQVKLQSSPGSTKQIGIKGTNGAGVTIYDSQALPGTSMALSNILFDTVSELYVGDLASTCRLAATVRTATLPASDDSYGMSSLYVPSSEQLIIEAGISISVLRATGSVTPVSVELFS